MNSELCIAEFKRLSDVSTMTRLMKLIAVREVDCAGFSEWLHKCMSLQDSIRLTRVLAAGSYREAMTTLCMEYEDCYWVVSHGYETLEKSLELSSGYVNPDIAFEFLIRLMLGGDQISILRGLVEYDEEYFEYLVSLTRIKPKVLTNMLEYIKCGSIPEVAEVYGVTESAARNAVAKLYKAVYVAAGDVSLPESVTCFLEQLEELDVRGRNVLLQHRCKSSDDVRALLERTVPGLGAASKIRIRKWLLRF